MLQSTHTIACLYLLCLMAGCEIPTSNVPPRSPSVDAPPAPVVVAYLPDYRAGSLDPDTLWVEPVTDLIYFSLKVPVDGVFNPEVINTDHLEVLKKLQKKAGCRLLICIGGWGRSDGFATIARDASLRQKMVQSLGTLCLALDFDGVDYDWEHPADAQQTKDYGLLIQATADHFKPNDLIVTVAQAGSQNLGKATYNAVDRIHLMCYDQAYPQATMRHAKDEVDQLLGWHCPANKIAMGIPFYGRNQTGQTLTYGELAEDNTLGASTDQALGYAFNGPDTVANKTSFVIDKGLAGVMVWEVTQDQPQTQTLLRAIAEQIKSAHPSTQ